MKIKTTFLFTFFVCFGISWNCTSQTNIYVTNPISNPGIDNVVIGKQAGLNINSAAAYNTFVGSEAGKNTSYNFGDAYSAKYNVFVGFKSGTSNTIGKLNTFIGANSGKANTNGYFNSFVGTNSGLNNTIGFSNVFFGESSGYFNKEGYNNVFIGKNSGLNNKTGYNNVYIGLNSGNNNNDNDNTYIGKLAGSNGSGSYNTYLGSQAGSRIQGSGNVMIGNLAGDQIGFFNNQLYINNRAGFPLIFGNFNDKFVNIPKVGIGFNSKSEPGNTLEIKSSNGGSGLRFTHLTSQSNAVASNGKALSVNSNGDVVLQNISQLNTTNLLTSVANIMNSKVNNISSSANIINTLSNSVSSSNQLVTTVNGVQSNPVNLPLTNVTAGTNVTVTGNGSVTTPFVVSAISTDNQNLTLTGNTLSIANGNTVTLPSTNVTAGTNVTVTGNGSATTPFVVSAISTDNQNLTLTGNTISISNGNSIVLPSFVDTDAQSLSISGNNISISNGNTITIPSTNVTAGTNVTVSGNGSVTTPFVVSAINNNTDNQNLTLSGNTLSISGGNTISLPTTSIISGSNVTVSGSGTSSSPFQINAIDTSLYSNNGIINQSTTTGLNRVVDMNDRNIWFNSSNSPANGKIYIGTNSIFPSTTGNYKLFVEGGILTEKVKVALRNTGNWADYVFDSNYELMPLTEVEQYISKNNHLPGIESAEDLTKNGLDLAEMQAKQMAKIEELTLYVIEQNKKLELQNNALQNQNKEIEELKLKFIALTEKIK